MDALLFECILEGEGIDDGGKHAHMIGGNAIHVTCLLGDAAEEVAASHDDCDLHAERVNVGQFGRDLMDAKWIDAETLRGGQSFARELEEDTFKDWGCHGTKIERIQISVNIYLKCIGS